MDTKLIPPETNTTPEVAEEEGKVMGFFDHIEELRMRIIRSVVAIVIGMLISLAFTNEVIRYISASYGQPLQILEPAGSVSVFLRVAFMLGAILAMPVLTYHLFMFVLPGLTRKERRWVFLALPGTTFLFLFGLVFTWFFLIPLYIGFLSTFQSDIFKIEWTADSFITFITTVLFWHGVAFEAPVLFYALARMGVVTARGMIRYWRQAIAGSALLAAIITPTVDPMTMSAIMFVLLGLYIFSIAMVAIATRINRRRLGTLGSA